MKVFAVFFLLFTNIVIGYGQTLDESIKQVSDDLAQKLSKKHLTKVGLLDFVDERNRQNAAIVYIQEQVEMNLINAVDLSVMDRKHITELLSENKLVSAGLINEILIKKAVSFIKVDGWVIGEITNFGNKFKLKLKVINIATSQILAVSVSGMIDATELNKIMQPKPCFVCLGTGSIKSLSKCSACNGTGGDKCTFCGGTGKDVIAAGLGGSGPCSLCQGKGKNICATCKGTGQEITYNPCKKCNGTGKQL